MSEHTPDWARRCAEGYCKHRLILDAPGDYVPGGGVVADLEEYIRRYAEELTTQRDALLEACEELLEECTTNWVDPKEVGYNAHVDLLNKARDAIAKARKP